MESLLVLSWKRRRIHRLGLPWASHSLSFTTFWSGFAQPSDILAFSAPIHRDSLVLAILADKTTSALQPPSPIFPSGLPLQSSPSLLFASADEPPSLLQLVFPSWLSFLVSSCGWIQVRTMMTLLRIPPQTLSFSFHAFSSMTPLCL